MMSQEPEIYEEKMPDAGNLVQVSAEFPNREILNYQEDDKESDQVHFSPAFQQ